jgi:hypothetical protein
MSFSLLRNPLYGRDDTPRLPTTPQYGGMVYPGALPGTPFGPIGGMAKMANGGYTVEPGTPFYNYMKGNRSKISGAGGYF